PPHSGSPFVSCHAPATADLYPLPLHDALPISAAAGGRHLHRRPGGPEPRPAARRLRRRRPAEDVPDRHVRAAGPGRHDPRRGARSEEHTSELQSLTNLVCRLLLEKKNALTALT